MKKYILIAAVLLANYHDMSYTKHNYQDAFKDFKYVAQAIMPTTQKYSKAINSMSNSEIISCFKKYLEIENDPNNIFTHYPTLIIKRDASTDNYKDLLIYMYNSIMKTSSEKPVFNLALVMKALNINPQTYKYEAIIEIQTTRTPENPEKFDSQIDYDVAKFAIISTGSSIEIKEISRLLTKKQTKVIHEGITKRTESFVTIIAIPFPDNSVDNE